MEHRILILLLFYNRPTLVRNTLRSILRSNEHYANWELAFIDDSSPVPGKPIVEEVLADHLDKVRFYNSNMTVEEKVSTGGMLGALMNQAIRDSSADIGIILCDDDELVDNYLHNLNRFFNKRPRAKSCYCHVHEFVPGVEDTRFVDRTANRFNAYTGPINPISKVDASQVAWRLSINKDLGVWFREGRTRNLDGPFFTDLRHAAGRVRFAGVVGQYKGVSGTAMTNFLAEVAWAGKEIDAEASARTISREHYLQMIASYRARGLDGEADRILEIAERIYGPIKGSEVDPSAS